MKLKLTIILLCFSSFAFCQNHVEYRKHINEAEIDFKKGDYKNSLLSYNTAFEIFNVNAFDFVNAAICASKINQLDKTYKFLQKAVLNGYEIEGIPHRQDLNGFAKSPYMDSLKLNYQDLRTKFLHSINIDFFIALKELLVKDNLSRKIYTNYDDQGNCMNNEIFETNMLELRVLFDKYGFEGYKQVGSMGVMHVNIILLHGKNGVNDSLEIEYFKPILKELILEGNYAPDLYAYWLDGYNWSVKQKNQIYGTINIINENGVRELTQIDDIKNVDSRRYELGLESLADFAFKMGIELPLDYKK